MKTGLIAAVILLLTVFVSLQKAECAPKGKAAASGIVPVVDYSCLIGGFAGGKWVGADAFGPKMRGGEKYRLYSLTKYLGEGVGGKVTDEPAGLTVTISNLPADEYNVVALGMTKWNPMPRAPKLQSAGQKVYKDEVAKILDENGAGGAPVKLKQVIRVDLEGDGIEEVLISASNMPEGGEMASDPDKSNYALVFLRKVIGGKVKTIILDKYFYTDIQETDGGLLYDCEVRGVLDVDGDGALEILDSCFYYEGGGLTVYKVRGGKVTVLVSGGCGV